jgi:lipopolysaccharide export LptBFGC system permease protein LptF
MDNALTQLVSWNFLLFSLCVVVVTYIIRTILEYKSDKLKDLNFWNKLALPLMPIAIGVILASLIKDYPYSESIKSLSARIMFGSVSGLLSGLLWRLVKALINSKIYSNGNNDKADGLTNNNITQSDNSNNQ